jgi:lipoate-protein ligase A
MAADEALSHLAEQTGQVLMRLYGWHPATVSLGSFQGLATAHRVSLLGGWPLVRRPSGGGAIVHGTDVTYGLAVPTDHPLSRRAEDLYAAVHSALVAELRERGLNAKLATADPTRAEEFFCFSRRSFGDVVVGQPDGSADAGDNKVLGSAQRRLAGVVLQHGSLLLQRHPLMSGAGSHPGLADLAGVDQAATDPMVRGWLVRLATSLGGDLREQVGPSWKSHNFDVGSRATRYASQDWLSRR